MKSAKKTPAKPRSLSPLAEDVFDFLCERYVQRADERQKIMGLQYTTAETHDLAEQLAKFIRLNRGHFP
jgi:hypothetical protein